MRGLATFCYRRRRIVLAAWLIALIGVTFLSRAAGSAYSNTFNLPNTESTRALKLLQANARRQSGDTEQIVVATSDGTPVTSPVVVARVEPMLAKVTAIPHVGNVVSPYSPNARNQVSADHTVAFADVTFDQQAHDLPQDLAKTLVDTAHTAAGGGVQVAVSGQLASRGQRRGPGGTGIGILAAAVVLFLVFGSLLAMALPMIAALVSLGLAIAVVSLLSHVVKLPQFSDQLILLIGLGVGVDYALFILSRYRQGLVSGKSPEEATVIAVDTSGRAVLFAGIIVCIALLGMFALRVSFLYGLAIAASVGVVFTMVSAITLLPALLGFFGPKVLRRRERRMLAEGSVELSQRVGFWHRWTGVIAGQPFVVLGGALAIMIVLAIPFVSLRLGNSDAGNDPKSSTTRQAYDLLAKGFGPGFNGPLQVVAPVHTPSDGATFARLVDAVRSQPNVASVSQARTLGTATKIAEVQVYPRSAPQDAATTDLINHIRRDVVPSVDPGRATTIYVGGSTAIFTDFARVLTSKLPLFIGVVVLLSFVLLAVVFRSVAVPLTAAAMNLVSAGAAFGILTAVFQWGWAGSLLGVNRKGPIDAFLPVMLFAILFGLSMDYEVFLISRIHEEWLHTGDNRRAVTNGLDATGRTITAAAAIMVLVFGAFLLGGERVIKEFGLGLAGAIAVDAVVVRSAVVPSVMLALGNRNWWFPEWLDRVLPRLAVEPPELLAEPEGDDLGPPILAGER
ncbi:MAG: MMPL family transporter [Acidimicrobiia bacterium]|nr:MMPL family transporter [Acidimicrobiia bacterium]